MQHFSSSKMAYTVLPCRTPNSQTLNELFEIQVSVYTSPFLEQLVIDSYGFAPVVFFQKNLVQTDLFVFFK